MSLGRRDFLIGTVGSVASLPLLNGCDSSDDGNPTHATTTDPPIAMQSINAALFAHGVASGDPLANAVILWTRVTQSGTAPVTVEWRIASDPGLTQIVQQGTISATADHDFTAKVDVTQLSPGTTYYYAFFVHGQGRSVTGRTRTLPTTADHARIAYTSCANYQNGFFNGYRAIANRTDLDLWVHLGDYIYEYGDGVYGDVSLGRTLLPAGETVTLSDYRTRYALYRSDPDLQELHRQLPLIAVWDDHEFADNSYKDGARNHNEATQGSWTDRKRAASRAFLEWLPLRVPDGDPVAKIFRTFAYGDLFDLIMLDTRMIGRDKQAGTDNNIGEDVGTAAQWTDPTRQILGTEQEAWFLQALSDSRARNAGWRLIGNQIVFAQTRSPLAPYNILFSDFWDGYQAARERVINHIVNNGITNVAFLTGDIHSSFALEINTNPYATPAPAPFSVELVGPSITSQAFEDDDRKAIIVQALMAANPHLKYGEVTRKGYVLLDVTPERIQAEWYFVMHKVKNNASEELAISFTCAKDAARLVSTNVPSTPKANPPAAAPA